MKKIKEINKKETIKFLIIFIIVCIIFIPFLKGHYAADSYNITNIGYQKYAIEWSLNDGRIIMAILSLIAGKLNLSIESYVFITLLSALFVSSIAILKLTNIIKKYKEPKNIFQEIFLIAISYVTIFNFMYLEDMYFVESIVMALSTLLYMISADILVEKNKYYIIKSMVLAILGVICYQGTIGMFIAFLILFTILKNKNSIIQIILDLLKGAVICLVAVGLNIISVKIIGIIFGMKQTRLGNIKNIFENIKGILITLPYIMQNACNLFPKNALIVYLTAATIIIIIYQALHLKEKNEVLYKYLTIAIITILGSCVTYLLTLTSFYTGRLRNALGALMGILFIFFYVETDLLDKKKVLNILTYIMIISFIILNVVNYESIMIEHGKINKIEQEEVYEVDEYIKKYEEENDIKVTRIIKVPIRNNPNYAYTKNAKPATYDAIRTYWAVDGVINFYTHRNLQTEKLTDETKAMYKKSADKTLEYQCIDDILYIKVYVF